jgi:uncharacterized protein YneF (UPF0154 family)
VVRDDWETLATSMLRVMMMQMGQNPSQKKINQIMKAMQKQQSK